MPSPRARLRSAETNHTDVLCSTVPIVFTTARPMVSAECKEDEIYGGKSSTSSDIDAYVGGVDPRMAAVSQLNYEARYSHCSARRRSDIPLI